MSTQELMAELARRIPCRAPAATTGPVGAPRVRCLDRISAARPLAVVLAETQKMSSRQCASAIATACRLSRAERDQPFRRVAAVPDVILIALNKLNRILRIDIDTRVAVVEPGVVNLDVSRAVVAQGLYHAPDPPAS